VVRAGTGSFFMTRMAGAAITDNTCAADRMAKVRVMAGVPIRAVVVIDSTCAALDDPGIAPGDPCSN